MLKIARITVTNFRSIHLEEFELPELTILIGKNDVGKSNIMDAIAILLEGTATSVSSEDFYDANSALEIRAVLEGVREHLFLCDERNRAKVDQRLDGNGFLTIRRLAAAPRQLGEIEVLDPQSGEFSNVTGISAALKPMLPEVIFIEALADVADQTKGTQKDALGKLINQVLSGIVEQLQPKLEEAYGAANKVLNVSAIERPEDDERAPQLKEIESEITGYLKDTFPNASVRLRVELASVQQIMEHVHVLIREGDSEDSYYRRGHGMQRALYLSLLRAQAAKMRRGQTVSRPFILLFEEPEAFLHPDGQIKMRDALTSISAGAQVVIATHSPLMVTPDSLPRTVRIEKCRKAQCPKPVTRGFGPIKPSELSELQRQLIPLFAIQRSSRFLFSRGVLLVEGTSDEQLFSAVAERMGQFRFDDYELAVVETGGKDKFVSFVEILKMLGLQVWVLTDLDFLWNGAGAVLGGDADLTQFTDKLHRLAPPTAGGADEHTKRAAKTAQKNACINQLTQERDALCEKLLMRGIFVLRNGEIEDYVNLTVTSKGQYLKAAEEIRAGQRVPNHLPEFERILAALRAWAAIPVVAN